MSSSGLQTLLMRKDTDKLTRPLRSLNPACACLNISTVLSTYQNQIRSMNAFRRDLPNSTRAVSARVQSGARIVIEANITAALKACVQKKGNRKIITGSRLYRDLTLPRIAQALP